MFVLSKLFSEDGKSLLLYKLDTNYFKSYQSFIAIVLSHEVYDRICEEYTNFFALSHSLLCTFSMTRHCCDGIRFLKKINSTNTLSLNEYCMVVTGVHMTLNSKHSAYGLEPHPLRSLHAKLRLLVSWYVVMFLLCFWYYQNSLWMYHSFSAFRSIATRQGASKISWWSIPFHKIATLILAKTTVLDHRGNLSVLTM